MKRLIVFTTCIFTFGAAYAQKTAATPGTAKRAAAGSSQPPKCAIGGDITDARKHPIDGVEAFIYMPDSSIVGSGYTDNTGHYETNSVLPGKYFVKVVYPSGTTVMVTGVTMRLGITPLDFKGAIPTADTTYDYATLYPKEDKKKTGGSKKK